MAAIQIRITLVAPLAGVLFCLQDRDNVLSQQTLSTGANLSFDLVFERGADGRVRGKHAMGPPAQRFFYINSGMSAGQFGTCWTRRAKVSLMNLPAGTSFAGTIRGTNKDGGPVCASVPLLDGGWVVTSS
jgi:hypothetical protein